MEKNTTTVAERASSAAANITCWDFTHLSLSDRYKIGDTLQTNIGTVELKHYLLDGRKQSKPEAVAYAQNTQIAGAGAPELRMYLINAHVEPDPPLSKVTFRFGHQGQEGQRHANIGVNGELREVTDSLTSLNGQELGDAAIGRVEVVVTLDQPPGQHEKGSVELRVVSGVIEKFSLGGVQFYLKNVCLTA